MNETMGKRIQRLRKNKGLTQDQLAEQMNVTAQAVSKWENDVSMPDIQSITHLAEVLGVTTDELLGVSAKSDASVDESKKESVEIKWDGGKRGWIFAAVLLILTGVSYLICHMPFWPFEVQSSIWQIVWPVAILGAGVSTMSRRFSVFSVGLLLCGAYYLAFNLHIIEYSLSWSIVIAVLLILFGIALIIDRLTHKNRKHKVTINGANKKKASEREENGYANIDVAFGDCTHKMESPVFRGADIDVSFGEGALYLTTSSSAAAGAEINADVSFGELKIYAPKSMRISPETDKAFSSMTVTGEPDMDAPYCIKLTADISFGNINIIYQ